MAFRDLKVTAVKVEGKCGRTKPGATYEAGDRTGRLPETLPLDFVEFAKAFTTGGAPLAGIDAKADAALTAAKAAMAKRAQEKAGKEVAA